MNTCQVSEQVKKNVMRVGVNSVYITLLQMINPQRMREGYGTWFVIRCPSSCRDQRSLLCAGKVMT